MEGVFNAGMISLLELTPDIIQKKSGVVHQMIDPSD